MKEDQHYIDKIFSEALTDYQELPDDGAWEGIAVGVTSSAASTTKLVIWKKIIGALLISGYLLVGPLFYSDVLFDTPKPGLTVQTRQEPKEGQLNASHTDSGTQSENTSEDFQSETSELVNAVENDPVQPMTESPSEQQISEYNADEHLSTGATEDKVDPLQNTGIAANERINDFSRRENTQEGLTWQPEQLNSMPNEVDELDKVVMGLNSLGYAYRTFLFPVLDGAVPIDSTNEVDYYKEAWKWYVAPYAMPVYWAGTGIGRAQLGLDVGRYLNGNSSVQIGIRYQFSSGDPRMGDSGVLTVPLQYRRYFGKSQFRWFLGAGAVFIPGASPARPFEGPNFGSNYFDLELLGGMIYHPSDKMRFFVSPSWQLPYGGEHGVSVQLGVQFRF